MRFLKVGHCTCRPACAPETCGLHGTVSALHASAAVCLAGMQHSCFGPPGLARFGSSEQKVWAMHLQEANQASVAPALPLLQPAAAQPADDEAGRGPEATRASAAAPAMESDQLQHPMQAVPAPGAEQACCPVGCLQSLFS